MEARLGRILNKINLFLQCLDLSLLVLIQLLQGSDLLGDHLLKLPLQLFILQLETIELVWDVMV